MSKEMGAMTQRAVVSANVNANTSASTTVNESAQNVSGDRFAKLAAKYGMSKSEFKQKMISRGNSLINSAVHAVISNPEVLTHSHNSIIARYAAKDSVFRSMLKSEFHKAKTAIFKSVENLNAKTLLANWGLLERVAPGQFNKEQIVKNGVLNGELNDSEAKKYLTETFKKYDQDEIKNIQVKDLYQNDIDAEKEQNLEENLNAVNNQAELLSKNGKAPETEKANFFANKESSEMTSEQAKEQDHLKQEYVENEIINKVQTDENKKQSQSAKQNDSDNNKEVAQQGKKSNKKSLKCDSLTEGLVDCCDDKNVMAEYISSETGIDFDCDETEDFADWLTLKSKKYSI